MAGSVVIGVLVNVPLGGQVAFCMASELAAIPLILAARARTRSVESTLRRWSSPESPRG